MKYPAPTPSTAIRLALVFTLALALAVPTQAPAQAPAPNGQSGEISKTEWAAYLRQSPELRAADSKLNATYKRLAASLSSAAKKKLIAEQRAWIRERNAAALAGQVKGSDGYCRALALETLAREAVLAELRRARQPENPPPPERKEPAASPARPAAPPPVLPPDSPKDKTGKAANGQAGRPEQAPDASIAAPAPAPDRTPGSRSLDITPARFAEAYNQLAHSFQSAPFPLAPTGVTSGGNSLTEQYRVSDAILVQFKYGGGNFKNPEAVTFTARRFMGGTTREKDAAAYALVNLLKTLHKESPRTPEAKDAEIFAFLRSINNAFTADASRVWRNGGLVHVVTYLQKDDLFAMVISREDGK